MADNTFVNMAYYSGTLPLDVEKLPKTTEIGGFTWVAGVGDKHADLMVIGASPHWDAARYNDPFYGKSGDILKEAIRQLGIDQSYTIYMTNAVKFYLDSIKDKEYRQCLKVLLTEIEMVKPKVILCLGSPTLKSLTGKEKLVFSEHRGSVIDFGGVACPIVATWHPAYIAKQPEAWEFFLHDISKVAALLEGKKVAKGGQVGHYETIDSPEKLTEFLVKLKSKSKDGGKSVMVALDAEWEGERALDMTYGYMRTLQLTNDDVTGVLKFYPCSSDVVDGVVDPTVHYPNCLQINEALTALKNFGLTTKMYFIGHNVKADGMWLYRYGFDIRKNVVYDTMLVEHLLSNLSQLGLEELTMKYTTMGRYDAKLVNWKRANPGVCSKGYGAIPDDVLIPYAAGDTQATWKIYEAQMSYIISNRPGMLSSRGHSGKYPSLIRSTVLMQKHLYEFELEGLPIDLELMSKLTEIYNNKARELRNQIMTTAATIGFTDFNPNSHQQVKDMLFSSKGLQLTPIHSTGVKPKSWEWVMQQPLDVRQRYQPSSDSKSLELLSKQHAFPKLLLQHSRLSKMCTGFLREDASGGLTGMVWPDGRIHPEFGQLTDTGRLTSKYPNVQNWSKLAEIKMWEVFGGKDKAPPSMRTMVKAPEGYKIIEADFKQAELFVLAGLSGDKVMMEALTTPGKDLHDITTISSFSVKCFTKEGKEIDTSEDLELLALAKTDHKAHDAILSSITYVLPNGKKLTRSEFKKGLRTAGKAVNFGISYGRGAAAIAGQIEVETGVKLAESVVQQAIDGWKNKFKVAWAFIERHQMMAVDPGYVENPWGRRRYFEKKETKAEVAANQREAGNFPIQSTVADCMSIATEILNQRRSKDKLGFKMINQIHDAFLFLVPEKELEITSKIIEESMGVSIPLPSGESLVLGVDLEVYDRWCA